MAWWGGRERGLDGRLWKTKIEQNELGMHLYYVTQEDFEMPQFCVRHIHRYLATSATFSGTIARKYWGVLESITPHNYDMAVLSSSKGVGLVTGDDIIFLKMYLGAN